MNTEEKAALLALLSSIDEWLGNDEVIMIEAALEWRDRLAKVLGVPERS